MKNNLEDQDMGCIRLQTLWQVFICFVSQPIVYSCGGRGIRGVLLYIVVKIKFYLAEFINFETVSL